MMEVEEMTKQSHSKREPKTDEARIRVKEKAKELRKKNIVPPIDEDEPLGPLSGGPEHLDLSDEDESDS
ncbi:MAG: hypothetical protein LAT63_11385 [Marinobacter sp.]|nr:hypothetical protein [Marinobacter sp.]